MGGMSRRGCSASEQVRGQSAALVDLDFEGDVKLVLCQRLDPAQRGLGGEAGQDGGRSYLADRLLVGLERSRQVDRQRAKVILTLQMLWRRCSLCGNASCVILRYALG